MTSSLRIALLLDPTSVSLDGPLSIRVRWGNHAPPLARELLGRGHTVRGFGAPPGLIPRSSEVAFEGATAPGWGKLRAFRPEVLLAYEARSPAAVRGARMARKLGSALVLVDSALPERGRPFARVLTRVGERLWGPYVRRTAGGFIALDEPTRLLAQRLGFAPELVRVVRPGVDANVYRPGLSSTLVSRHRIRGRILLYVGRMSDDRGVGDLISAFSRTVGQRADWNLVLAGDGPAVPTLRLTVERLGVGDRVHWLLRPREEELPGLYSAATLLAVPARGEGASGRQIPRALATGLPILVSDLPRFRGWVRHDEQGLVVRPGDVEAWTEALRHAAGSPHARRRWSTNGRQTALERFDWRAVAAEFETAFLEARERVLAKLALRNRTLAEPSS